MILFRWCQMCSLFFVITSFGLIATQNIESRLNMSTEEISLQPEISYKKMYSALNSNSIRGYFSGHGLFINAATSYISKTTFSRFRRDTESGLTGQCSEDVETLVSGIKGKKLWALSIADATAKIPSGLLVGNHLWLGSYDECLGTIAPRDGYSKTFTNESEYFKGKYCTSGLSYDENTTSPALQKLLDRVEFGICIPSSCSETDANAIVNDYFALTQQTMDIQVKDVKCLVPLSTFDTKTICFITIFIVYGVLLVIATLYDAYCEYTDQPTFTARHIKRTHALEADDGIGKLNLEELPLIPKDVKTSSRTEYGTLKRLFLAFSVYTNGKKLLKTNVPDGSLTCLYGIRFFSIAWVILGHTYTFQGEYIANAVWGYNNMKTRWLYQVIINATVSVDTFFAMSGILVSYMLLKELQANNGKINWFMFYFHRYLRLTPVYMILVFFNISAYTYLMNGPKWSTTKMQDACAKYWWQNILYINNFWKCECFRSSWYVANDMQFYILSPLFIVPLFYSKAIGIVLLSVGILATTILDGVMAYEYALSPTGQRNREHDESAFNLYYIKPYCRIGPYLVGVVTGYILYSTKLRYNINKYVNCFCFLAVVALGLAVVYGVHDDFSGDHLPRFTSNIYTATHRTVWAACVCYVIFMCSTGNGGFVNTFLSWKAFIPLGRLTYCVYLVNSMVIYLYSMSLRVSSIKHSLSQIRLFLACLVICFLAAVVVSLAFEAPIMAIEKILLKRKSTRDKEDKNKMK